MYCPVIIILSLHPLLLLANNFIQLIDYGFDFLFTFMHTKLNDTSSTKCLLEYLACFSKTEGLKLISYCFWVRQRETNGVFNGTRVVDDNILIWVAKQELRAEGRTDIPTHCGVETR